MIPSHKSKKKRQHLKNWIGKLLSIEINDIYSMYPIIEFSKKNMLWFHWSFGTERYAKKNCLPPKLHLEILPDGTTPGSAAERDSKYVYLASFISFSPLQANLT